MAETSTTETETTPKTAGTPGTTTTARPAIVFSDAQKWLIQQDARRAVCSRPARLRLF